MRKDEELRALVSTASEHFQREVGGELSHELLKRVVDQLHDEAAARFIKQRLAHLLLHDLHNLKRVLADGGRGDEEPANTAREVEHAPEPRTRGRPRKGSAEGTKG